MSTEDLALALDLAQREPLHGGVGPVAADPVLAEDADAEDRVLDRALAPGRRGGACRARPSRRGSARGRPCPSWTRVSSTSRVPHRCAVPRGRRLLGLGVLDPERAGLLTRHVLEIAADHLLRLAAGVEPPLVEPHRLVAEPLDAAEIVRDQDDRLPARLELLDLAHAACWKASSPTASTSSIRRMSGSTVTAIANPRRMYMPDE